MDTDFMKAWFRVGFHLRLSAFICGRPVFSADRLTNPGEAARNPNRGDLSDVICNKQQEPRDATFEQPCFDWFRFEFL
jgi:hypothetical protein